MTDARHFTPDDPVWKPRLQLRFALYHARADQLAANEEWLRTTSRWMEREQRELIAVLLEVQKRRERLDAALARAEAVARDIAVERADQDDELDFIDDQSRRLARHEGRSVEEENWPEGT